MRLSSTRPELGRPSPSVSADALRLLVDAMATYRLTRLATADVISEPLRRSIVVRSLGSPIEEVTELTEVAEETEGPITAQEAVDALTDPPKVARLITCRWCAGMWIAAGVVAARRLAPKAWDPLADVLALSAAAVLAARLED